MLLVVTSVTSLGPQGHRQGHRVIAEPSSIPAKPVSSVRSTIVFQGWIQSLGTRGVVRRFGGTSLPPPPPVQNSISIGSAVSARLTCRLSPAICVRVCAQMYTQRDRPVKAKFHYTDPTGPVRTQRSFAAKKVLAGPCGSGRVRVGSV